MADEEQIEEEIVDRGDGVEEEAPAADAALSEEEKSVAEGEKAEAEGEEEKTPEPMLPKRRYDTQARARKAAEEKAAELQAKIDLLEAKSDSAAAPATVEDVNARMKTLDKELEAARSDGDMDKVFDLMGEQRSIQTQFFMDQLDTKTGAATTAATQQTKLDATIDALEGAYDILNADSDDFDPDLVEEINELSDALQLKGYEPADALIRATDLIYPQETDSNVVHLSTKRTTDVAKNVKAANGQPPDASDAGKDSDTSGMTGLPDGSKLSTKEFDELPEETKSRLRGDVL